MHSKCSALGGGGKRTPEVKQVAKHHASADDGVAHALLELVRATKAGGDTSVFMMEN